MQIRDLPYTDPGDPDVRSGPRFLYWLGRNQLGGQLKALGWGLLHQLGIAGLPVTVGVAVQAVIERSGTRLALAGGLILALGILIAVGDTMLHRTAVTNWITAAARVQQLLARKTAELGAALTRRVAAGEVVAVSTGDVEKIGWFVEALSRFLAAAIALVVVCVGLVVYLPALGVLVAVAMPVLALAVLPLLPRATRRADEQREKAGKATELASDTVAGLRVLRGIGGEELFLGRYRRASQEVRKAAVRSARMWALISAVQVLLPGILLISLVWYGATLARDGRIDVGQLVTVYSAVTLMLFPLRHFEEIAMAYSFSRPSAQRAVRVLSLRRSDRTATEAGVPSGDLYDPATGLMAPQGQFTAVVCGDPDEAGRLAERLGGHAETGDQDTDTEQEKQAPSVLLGAVALDELPLDTARTVVLVQDKDPVLLSGTLQELLDVPSSGLVTAEAALEAAQCGDVLAALAQASPTPTGTRCGPGSPSGAGRSPAVSASASRWPGRSSPTRRRWCWTSRPPPSTRTPRRASPPGSRGCAGAVRRSRSPPRRCCWTSPTGSSSSTRAAWSPWAPTATCCAPNRATGPSSPARPTTRRRPTPARTSGRSPP